jgi:hypothetical protein
MNQTDITLAIVVIFSIILLVTLVLIFMNDFGQPKIYCIMITGKNDQRLCFAKHAIKNFEEQDYNQKVLIIINHFNKQTPVATHQKNIFEFFVTKENNTLGDLRNIALQLVPIDGLWTIWDDDDYRVPNYLSMMANEMRKASADVVVFTKRIECNLNTNFVWELQLNYGFIFVLAKQDLRIRYLPKDSMEDVSLISDFRKLGKYVHIWYNNPSTMYIRNVHNNNTSLYVQKNKEKVISFNSTLQKNNVYSENNVSESTKNHVLNIMKTRFSECMV